RLPELSLSYMEIENETAKFDLMLACVETEQGLLATIEFRTDLFNDDTIERMLGHFQMLLHEAAENPDQALSEFSLLTAAEQNRLLVEWNDTRSPYSQDGFMHRLFEAQAARSPESIAVASLEGKLTYGELNERANKLARYLIEAGVERETHVGVCMRR